MFQNAVLVWVPKYRKLGRYVAHIGPTKMGGDTKGAVRQERKLCGGGPVAPRRCSCGRRCQRAWASRCCSGGQGPRAAALAWLEGQARRGFSLKPAHGARVKARPHMLGGRGRGGGRHRHVAAVARDCPRRLMGPLGRHFRRCSGGHPLRGGHGRGPESGGAGHPAVGGAHSEQCSP